MQTLTIFEHDTTTDYTWTDKDVAALDRLRDQYGAEVLQPTFRKNVHALKATQFVGMLRIGHRIIHILPKMYRPSANLTETEKKREAAANLLSMLSYAGDLPVHQSEITSLLQRDISWLEILTRLFSVNLMRLWQMGPARNYESCHDELPRLKGKWRFSDQLRRPDRRHILSVTYDEFTVNNRFNRVLRFVVEQLWAITRDSTNRQRLGTLRDWMSEVELPLMITAAEMSVVRTTHLNERFTPVMNLAKLFLQGRSLELSSGRIETYAVLFDMNRLFEDFLVNFIRRHRQAILPTELSNCDLLPQSKGISIHLAAKGNKPLFRLKPDLVFRSGTLFPLLMDAKYKILDPADRTLGVNQDDFYQMFAYSQCFPSPVVLLLYPVTAATSSIPLQRLEFAGKLGCVVIGTIDLRLDMSRSNDIKKLIDQLKEIFQYALEKNT
ncbi:MAG: mcrBC [Chthonomonadaceae bacterium]|nr:mcrBC [Chthonomonadaceae bacterium]